MLTASGQLFIHLLVGGSTGHWAPDLWRKVVSKPTFFAPIQPVIVGKLLEGRTWRKLSKIWITFSSTGIDSSASSKITITHRKVINLWYNIKIWIDKIIYFVETPTGFYGWQNIYIWFSLRRWPLVVAVATNQPARMQLTQSIADGYLIWWFS